MEDLSNLPGQADAADAPADDPVTLPGMTPATLPSTNLPETGLPTEPVLAQQRNRKIDPKAFPDAERRTPFQTTTTIENVEYMLRKAGISVRYNIIKKKTEISIPGHAGTEDNRDNATMTTIVSLAALNGMAVGLIPGFIEVIADRNAYNPVADWIQSKPWDGRDRLPEFCATVVERHGYPTKLKEILLRKWLLSGVAAALLPTGFRTRGVLTLQGPQGIGKTSWALALVSDPQLREQCVKVDHHLDTSNKDSVLSAVSHWIVELGELDSSFKKDIARLKGFLTSTHDKVRRPYARTDSEYSRRTIFIATVNENNFLVDTTGNSRWWTISVDRLNFNHGIDMQQLYAQLAFNLGAGEIWWLTDEEEAELARVNRPHESVSVVRELILGHVDIALIGHGSNPALTCTEMLVLLGIEKPTNAQAKECGSIFRELFGEPKRIGGRDKWRVPCRIIDSNPRRLTVASDPDRVVTAVTSRTPLSEPPTTG